MNVLTKKLKYIIINILITISKMPQPLNLSINLRQYQLNEISKMEEIEKRFKDNEIGLLKSKVGSGKTYTILGYLCSLIKSSTNLIIVPPTILSQWNQAIKNTSLNQFTIYSPSDIEKLYEDDCEEDLIMTQKRVLYNNYLLLANAQIDTLRESTDQLITQLEKDITSIEESYKCKISYHKINSYYYWLPYVNLEEINGKEVEIVEQIFKKLTNSYHEIRYEMLEYYEIEKSGLKKQYKEIIQYIKENEDIKRFGSKQILDRYDIILCPYNMYPQLRKITPNYIFTRIIIDEIQDFISKMAINCVSSLNQYKYLWNVSATIEQTDFNIGVMKKITNKPIKSFVEVSTLSDKIDKELILPNYNHYLTICKTHMNILHHYGDTTMRNLISQGNMNEVLRYLEVDVSSPINLVQHFTNQIESEIDSIKKLIESCNAPVEDEKLDQELMFLNYGIKEQYDIKELNKKLESLTTKLNSIKDRIENLSKNVCRICMDEIDDNDNPIFMKCCNQIFCKNCILHWSLNSNICPLCMTKLDRETFITLSNSWTKTGNKFKNDVIKKIIMDNPNGKFLIFNDAFNYNNSMPIESLLKENEIKFSYINGNAYTINNILNRFRNGEIKVLLINSENFASGMNLEIATDIIITHHVNKKTETQIIGRSQRYGRVSNLKVYTLYDNSEYDLYQQTSNHMTKIDL